MQERPDRRDVISATALPVLLVAGAEDSKVTPERTFTSDNRNITKVTLPGVGHMGMFEAPEQLAKIIKDFVYSPVKK